MRETYPPILLQRKVDRLRRETGNPHLTSAMADKSSRRGRLARSVRRPLVMLFRSPIVFLFSLFIAVVFSYQFLLFVTIPSVFGGTYGFSVGETGLAYLGIAVGLLMGNAVFGYLADRLLTGKAQLAEGHLKPEYRLPLMIPAAFCIPACFFIYGWTTHYALHWIVPIVATSLLGLGLNMSLVCLCRLISACWKLDSFFLSLLLAACNFADGFFCIRVKKSHHLTPPQMTIQVYLVDAYTLYAASALAAATVLRSIFGAFLPLAGPPLYDALGLGWGNSTLGFIAVGLIPVPLLFIRYGEAIRTNPRYQPAL